MNVKEPVQKTAVAITAAGVVLFGTFGLHNVATAAPVQTVSAASISAVAASASDKEQAIKTLNSFYKPALKGQFPGSVSGLTVGRTTRQEVVKVLGSAEVKGEDADAFDVYTANMGHPGYAFAYKLNTIREIRYFGTNVERQTNIGGITMKLLRQQWYAPSSTTTINSGKAKQTKITYVRGNYQLEFIFNSSTDLDHINLSHKA